MLSEDNYAAYVVRRNSYVLTVERKYMQTSQMTAVLAIWETFQRVGKMMPLSNTVAL